MAFDGFQAERSDPSAAARFWDTVSLATAETRRLRDAGRWTPPTEAECVKYWAAMDEARQRRRQRLLDAPRSAQR